MLAVLISPVVAMVLVVYGADRRVLAQPLWLGVNLALIAAAVLAGQAFSPPLGVWAGTAALLSSLAYSNWGHNDRADRWLGYPGALLAIVGDDVAISVTYQPVRVAAIVVGVLGVLLFVAWMVLWQRDYRRFRAESAQVIAQMEAEMDRPRGIDRDQGADRQQGRHPDDPAGHHPGELGEAAGG